MALFQPIWKSKNATDVTKIENHIKRIGNKYSGDSRDEKLLDIINNAFLEEAKQYAIEWISSPLVLKELLMKGLFVSTITRVIASKCDNENSQFSIIDGILVDVNCPNDAIAPLLYKLISTQKEKYRIKYFFDVSKIKKDNALPSLEKIISNAETKGILLSVNSGQYFVSQRANFIILDPTADKSYDIIKCYVGNGHKYHPDMNLPTTEGVYQFSHQTEIRAANERGYNILKIPKGIMIGCVHIGDDTVESTV